MESSITSATDHGQVSANAGDQAAGDFKNFPLIPEASVKNLKSKGYLTLFPIQQQCFMPIYNREDLCGRDLTGSGKTFAFGLPTIEYLRAKKLFGTGKV